MHAARWLVCESCQVAPASHAVAFDGTDTHVEPFAVCHGCVPTPRTERLDAGLLLVRG